MSTHHQITLGDITLYISPLTSEEQLIMGHVPAWTDEASEADMFAHADVEAKIQSMETDRVKRFFELVHSKPPEKVEEELTELGDSLTPDEVALVSKVKFLRRKRENLQKSIGAHAMRGTLMQGACVVKDADGIDWPKFKPGVPYRKVLNERMAHLGKASPAERDSLMDAVNKAILAGIGGLTEDEKKS